MIIMQIYNSLTFKKEEFKTIKQNEVLMYVCGPTVYDSPHIGHMKSAIVFDLIHRYLKFKEFKVNIVKNYTDIDDKVIKGISVIERKIGREINYKFYEQKEFLKKKKSKDAFLDEVLNDRYIPLKGTI